MLCFAAFLALPLLALSAPLPSPLPPSLGARSLPYLHPQVSFTSSFPPALPAGSDLELSWTGGSGAYNIYTMEVWPGMDVYQPNYLIRNTTRTTATFQVGELSDYHEGASLRFGVEEAAVHSMATGDTKWYQLTGQIDVVAQE